MHKKLKCEKFLLNLQVKTDRKPQVFVFLPFKTTI